MIALGERTERRYAASERHLYALFLFSLVFVSVPIKNLAYLLPPVYLLVQLLIANKASAWRTVGLMLLVVAVSSISLLIDAARGRHPNLPGMLLGVITFLPVLIVLSERFDEPVSDALMQRLIRTVAWFAIFQSSVGVGQFVLSGNSDAVAGTLGLLDFHFHTITIAHVYFNFLLLSMVLFLLLDYRTLLARTAIAASLVAFAISQSGHQTLFFAGALGLFALLQVRRLSVIVTSGLLLAGLLALVVHFYPSTVPNVRAWYHKMVDDPYSPKRMIVDAGLATLSDGKNLVLGTGIGQFSSRAALITSNEFLSARLPGLLVGKSLYYQRLIEPAIRAFDEKGEGSAVSKPYFSALTLLVELGLLQSVALAAVVAVEVGRNLRMTSSSIEKVARVGMLANVGLVFFLLCCFVENYAEFPQAIFIPFLLYVIARSWAGQSAAGERSTHKQEARAEGGEVPG